MSVFARILEGGSQPVKRMAANSQSPDYWMESFFGGTESATGVKVNADTALKNSAYWNAILIISGAVGVLPFILYHRLAGGGKERAANHNAYRLIHDRPNPYMDPLTFKQMLQKHALSWGNGYAEIERKGDGSPQWLWPLPPDKVEPAVTKAKELVYKVTITPGDPHYVSYDNMLHIKGMGNDGIKGYSVIEYARETIGFGLGAEKFGAKFFSNNASPSGVLEHPGSLTKEAADRLRDSVEATHRGLDKSHRLAVLEEGMKWHEVGTKPEDAQLLATRKFEVTEIARWFDIPPHMLKEMDRATFSNIEHQGIEFVTRCLMRWFKTWEHEADYKLLGPEGRTQRLYFSEFLADALLRGDTKSRYQAYQVAISSGWLSRAEVRELENRNPAEGLDEFLEPMNMSPVAGRMLPVLEDSWRRILTKETNAVRRLLKQPDTLPQRLGEFYDRHASHVESVLEPVVEAMGRPGLDSRRMAQDYAGQRLGELRALCERFGAAVGAERIEAQLAGWNDGEPTRLAEAMVEEVATWRRT